MQVSEQEWKSVLSSIEILTGQVRTLSEAITRLAGASTNNSEASTTNSASVATLLGRVESLEALLGGYATAKGDRDLLERLIQLEQLRQAEKETGIVAIPDAAQGNSDVIPFNPILA